MVENDENLCNTIIIPPGCNEQFLNLNHPGAELLTKGGVLAAGISELVDGYLIKRVAPEFHTVIFTTAGEGHLLTRDQEIAINKGSYFSVPPGCFNNYRIVGDCWNIVWFHLQDDNNWTRLRTRGVAYKRFNSVECLTAAMRGFLLESVTENLDSELVIRSYAELILVYLRRELDAGDDIRKSSLQTRLSQVFHTANQNPEKRWSTQSLAALAALSPSYFTRLCRKVYDTSPMKLLTRLRMERAVFYLLNTDYPIYIISQQIGYQDEFAFSTAFKRYAGVSPSQFRKKGGSKPV